MTNLTTSNLKAKLKIFSTKIAITGDFQGTSRECLYQELGLESSENILWYRILIYFHKIVNRATPKVPY